MEDVMSNELECGSGDMTVIKQNVIDFITKLNAIDQEIELLKGDKKELKEEYKKKLDMKTFDAALKFVKIRNAVEHKDTFDVFVEVLADPALS